MKGCGGEFGVIQHVSVRRKLQITNILSLTHLLEQEGQIVLFGKSAKVDGIFWSDIDDPNQCRLVDLRKELLSGFIRHPDCKNYHTLPLLFYFIVMNDAEGIFFKT
jgi:hypothetical protein